MFGNLQNPRAMPIKPMPAAPMQRPAGVAPPQAVAPMQRSQTPGAPRQQMIANALRGALR